jgi:hypothetical protein
MQKFMVVSKIDAAKRQLETVIRLYFSDGDPVPIHTLTAAAYNILRDVTVQRGADSMLIKGKLLEYVRPEYKNTIIAKTNEAENFFKHANRDHGATLDFNPETSELMIIDACSQYKKLTGEEPRLFVIYRIWFTVNNPDVFIFSDEFKKAMGTNAASIVQMGRVEFFKMAVQEATKQEGTPSYPEPDPDF